jgi:NAD(P) transhydrogenase subunit beta
MTDFLPTGIELSYLVAAALFILGLKKLGSPATARQGNLWAAIGMLLAVVATLLDRQVSELPDDLGRAADRVSDWCDRGV